MPRTGARAGAMRCAPTGPAIAGDVAFAQASDGGCLQRGPRRFAGGHDGGVPRVSLTSASPRTSSVRFPPRSAPGVSVPPIGPAKTRQHHHHQHLPREESMIRHHRLGFLAQLHTA